MITRISGVIRPEGSDLIFDHPYNGGSGAPRVGPQLPAVTYQTGIPRMACRQGRRPGLVQAGPSLLIGYSRTALGKLVEWGLALPGWMRCRPEPVCRYPGSCGRPAGASPYGARFSRTRPGAVTVRAVGKTSACASPGTVDGGVATGF
jgi:hypothetical protein